MKDLEALRVILWGGSKRKQLDIHSRSTPQLLILYVPIMEFQKLWRQGFQRFFDNDLQSLITLSGISRRHEFSVGSSAPNNGMATPTCYPALPFLTCNVATLSG